METPESFQSGYYNAQFTPEKRLSDSKNGDHFIIEDLLDFPHDENVAAGDGGLEVAMNGASTDSSTVTAVDTSSNSSFCGGGTAELHFNSADFGGSRGFAGGQFSSELCVPYDDMAELEWLSNFVEESFSSEDLQKLQLIQGIKTEPSETQFQPEMTQPGQKLRPEISVPGKARSKRSRAAPGDWTSRLQAVSTPPANTAAMSSSSEPYIATAKKAAKPKKQPPENSTGGGDGRRCLHCATDKTPQWRTGPMGPKTLCNACGVRYKSGRLVPEYRPAASPTFVLTKHSNSHRKVLELRRQKEVQRGNQVQQQQQHQFMQNVMFDVSHGDDYLIDQHVGPNFRQLI
ncbi:hypothetical protein BUALT_Bualt05G0015400 [Buddleja alternifolia]|uniref:GATA transcription factor n=1 Tax=Buddleja alternifolia TaxID=168488 RepID=A0AAV6XRW4_9LAMI|nr:hypothetical protein BUALT_Bualt05G0015400 [Buddleja alternifolia]